MFRTIQTLLIRPIAGAGLLMVASLAATPDAAAQTAGETAFMNRLEPTVYLPSGLELVYGTARPAPFAAADGEQALLGRTPGPDRHSAVGTEDSAPVQVSGAYALLGRRETWGRSLERVGWE